MTRTTAAWVIGIVPSAVAIAICRLLEVDSDVTAVLPIIPVGAAAVIGGRAVGVRVAVIAGVIYAVALLAPFGHMRIGFTHDMLVLAIFVAVAFVTGTLADRRRGDPPARQSAEPSEPTDPSDLLNAVSHDLRNPLSTIRAASSDLLIGRHDDDARRQELLGLVVNESERLDRIVGNLLNAGRARAGKLAPQLAPEPLAVVVGDSLSRLRQLHTQQLVMDVADDLPEVMIDAVQIDQVLANLVENSAKASPATSTICVSARAALANVVVTVTDEGPGFATVADNPFEAYVSSTGSSGLGLAICEAIITAHGGTIEVDPTRGHQGGRVRFTLPNAATSSAGPGQR